MKSMTCTSSGKIWSECSAPTPSTQSKSSVRCSQRSTYIMPWLAKKTIQERALATKPARNENLLSTTWRLAARAGPKRNLVAAADSHEHTRMLASRYCRQISVPHSTRLASVNTDVGRNLSDDWGRRTDSTPEKEDAELVTCVVRACVQCLRVCWISGRL